MADTRNKKDPVFSPEQLTYLKRVSYLGAGLLFVLGLCRFCLNQEADQVLWILISAMIFLVLPGILPSIREIRFGDSNIILGSPDLDDEDVAPSSPDTNNQSVEFGDTTLTYNEDLDTAIRAITNRLVAYGTENSNQHWEEAIWLYEKAIGSLTDALPDNHPSLWSAYSNWATLLLFRKPRPKDRMHKAEEFLRKALALHPQGGNAELLNSLGVTLVALDNNHEAAEAFQRALVFHNQGSADSPHTAWRKAICHTNLGRALKNTANYSMARETLMTAIGIFDSPLIQTSQHAGAVPAWRRKAEEMLNEMPTPTAP